MIRTLTGANSSEQMDINRKVGRIGEESAKDDYRELGYHILNNGDGMFFDFVAMRFLDDCKLDVVFVEVKVGNSQLSKRQRWFKQWCKRAQENFSEYRITRARLCYILETENMGDAA